MLAGETCVFSTVMRVVGIVLGGTRRGMECDETPWHLMDNGDGRTFVILKCLSIVPLRSNQIQSVGIEYAVPSFAF